MEFYTDCKCWGNNVLLRGIKNGKRFSEKVAYKPVLFTRTRDKSPYRTIHGEYLHKINFNSLKEAKDWLWKFKDVENFDPYGAIPFQYAYLSDRYPQDAIEYDQSKLVVANIDIEVESEHGFPTASQAMDPIISITIQVDKTYYILARGGKYKPHRDDIEYQSFSNEKALIAGFLLLWERLEPDIVTGWFINTFDIPYLNNRITNVLGEEEASRLSPWGIIRDGGVMSKGKELQAFDIYGIAALDYVNLYQKFAVGGSSQESYSLNNIANVELGEKKMSYEEYGSLHKLYKHDFQKFIEYNLRDVELVSMLEKKLKLISSALTLAYDAKCNYADVFSQVRMWDVIIYNHLKKQNIQIPPKKGPGNDTGYSGAFVKDPIKGKHRWVVSFDVDSEYPMTMVQWNMSPETIIKDRMDVIDAEMIVDGKYKIRKDILKEYDYALAANGFCFDRSKRGFLPEILIKMYEDRLHFKALKSKAQDELSLVEEEMKKRGMKLK